MSSGPIAPSEDAKAAASKGNTFGIAVIAAAGIVLFVINLIIIPSRFYDYDTYLLYLDNIYHFRQPDWFVFEGATKAYLLALREIFGTTEGAIKAAHQILLPIFLTGFWAIFRRSQWECVAIAAALFAPQMGLVTIRATPAYIICCLAAIRVLEGKPWGLRLALLGTTFHVSAFLAFMPILATKFLSKTRLASFNVSLPLVAGVGIAAALVAYLFAQTVFDILVDLFRAIPYLEKYSAYAVGLADPSSVVEYRVVEPTSANHYFFLGGVSALFIGLVAIERRNTLLKLFAAIGYVLYLAIFLGFSPVPAFRFAPFLVFPVLATVRLGERASILRGMAALPFLAACIVILVVQIGLVID